MRSACLAEKCVEINESDVNCTECDTLNQTINSLI